MITLNLTFEKEGFYASSDEPSDSFTIKLIFSVYFVMFHIY